MDRKNKLKKILGSLTTFDDQIEGTFKDLDKEIADVSEKLKEAINVKTLAQVNEKFKELKSKFNLNPLVDSISELKSSLSERQDSLAVSIKEQVQSIELLINDSSKDNSKKIEDTNKIVESLKKELEIVSLRKTEIPDFSKQIQKSESNMRDVINSLEKEIKRSDSTKELRKELKAQVELFQESINDLRSRFNSIGGGSANQKVSINGTVMSTRYADINLTGTGIIATNNNTTKQVDVDFSGLVGGSSLADVSADSTTTPKSLYTMTSTIPVEFRSSDNNPILYIDETNERIGVGTSSPLQKLHVSLAGPIGMVAENTSASSAAILQAGALNLKFMYDDAHDFEIADNTLANVLAGFGGGRTTRIIVQTGTGYVGIGNTSPQGILDIHPATNVNFTFSSSSTNALLQTLNDARNAYQRLILDTGILQISVGSGAAILFGTSTDSSNGKIQIATHTANTGGIGFGTDTPLWRSAAGILRFGDTGSDTAQLVLNGNGGAGLVFVQAAAIGTINANRSAGQLVFQTNTTTALTIDATQNATFAKRIIATGGSLELAYRAITALRTLDATDYTVDCTANTFTITLPTAVGITGRIYVIKNSGAGTITIDGAGTETIDGALTQTLAVQYGSYTIQSNGANWIII